MNSVWSDIKSNTTLVKYSIKYDVALDYNPVFGGKAETNFNMKIDIASNYFNDNSDKTLVVKTLVHEMIHIKLNNVFKDMTYVKNGKRYFKSNANALYPVPYSYFKKYGDNDQKSTMENNSTRNWQHNWMADFGRDDLIKSMKEQDEKNGIVRGGENYTAAEFYEAESFSGLIGTDAWNKLTSTTKNKYLKIIGETQDRDRKLYSEGEAKKSQETNNNQDTKETKENENKD